MNWEAAGAIGELVGAMAVFCSLFYLAVQIRQNTRQEEIQSFQTAIELYLKNLDQTTASTLDTEIFRKGLNQYENLSANEQGVFHSRMHSLLHGFHTVWKLFKSGTLPDYELMAMRNIYIEFLMTPGGQQWWNEFKHIPPPHLVDYLDEEIHKAADVITPATQAYSWLRPD